MTESGKLSANELAQMRTDLATSRNLMAADRTLMAWVRPSLVMALIMSMMGVFLFFSIMTKLF
jgi:uncharacterized membrane protein YidH (DUF202 family)